MDEGFLGFAVGGLFGFMVGGLMFCGIGTHDLKVDAVKSGAAEWVISDDGERGFRWLPAKPAEAKQ